MGSAELGLSRVNNVPKLRIDLRGRNGSECFVVVSARLGYYRDV